MSGASTLDPDNLPGSGSRSSDGRSTGALGPSDTSDSGSDVSSGHALGPSVLGSDTDASGTGEDAGAPGRADGSDLDRDVGFDRVVPGGEAGLGQGLDQAEEALLDEADGDDAPADIRDDIETDLADAGRVDDGLGDEPDDEPDEEPDPTRLAGAMHGGVDDDADDADEDEDEDEGQADENEGEPASPAIREPESERHERAGGRRLRP